MGTDGLELIEGDSSIGGRHTAAERAAEAAILDLDSLERDDPGANKPPFGFTVKGRRVELKDPVEIDWQELIAMADNPATFALAAMDEHDRIYFEAQQIPVWKIEKLIHSYQEYYDIEADQGK